MVRRWVAAALVLLLVGQGAAPAIDALLYHSKTQTQPASAHWDPPGGCDSHAEHCALRAAPLGPNLLPPSIRTVAVVDQPILGFHPDPATQYLSLAEATLQARAPPSVL